MGLIYLVLKINRKENRLKTIVLKLKDNIFYNVILRYIIEGYLEIFISSLINMY